MATLLPVAIGALLLLVHSLRFNFVTDDAYISFVYARNLARHGELVFNLGERVEGYTNFLWTVILGAFYKIGLAPEAMSRVLAFIASVGTLLVAVRWSERLAGVRSPLHILPTLLLGAWGGFACWTSGGLETALFTFLVTFGLYLAATEAIDLPNSAASGRFFGAKSGIVLALAAMTRPEGALVFAIVVFHRAIWNLVTQRRVLPKRYEIGWIVGFLLIFVPFFAWRMAYYGYPFPNTYYIKASGGAGTMTRGLYYLKSFVRDSHLWYAIVPLVASVAIALFGSPGKTRCYRRHMVSLVPLFVGVYFLYVAKVGGDFMGLYRFVLPVVPAIAVVASDGILGAGRALLFGFSTPAASCAENSDAGPRAPKRLPAAAVYGLLIAFALVLHGIKMNRVSHRAITWIGADNGIDSPGFLRKYTRDRATIGKWFFHHAERTDYMSVGGAGAQPWYGDLRALDAFGLSDEFIAHKVPAHSNRPGHQKWAPDSYVFERRPTILCHIYQLTNSPNLPPSQLSYYAREGYYFVTVRIPNLDQHYSFAVLLTERGAPILHGQPLEDRIATRLKLMADDLVKVWDPPIT